MKNYIYSISFFLLVSITQAQEKQMRLSMQDAISFALKNNFKAKEAKNNIAAAKKKKWETTTIGLPQINASVDYQNWLKQQVSLLPAAAFDNTSSVVKTVEQYFGLNANSNPTVPEGFLPLTFGTKQNVNASVTLSQLLFDGSYLVGLQSAKTYLKISEQAKEKTDLAIKEGVINAYGNVLVSEKTIAILERNKKVNDRLLNGAQQGFKNGLAEEEQVEQFEIIKGNIDSNIRNAKRLKTIAYQMLNISLGNPINEKLILTDNLDDMVIQNTDITLLSKVFNINNHVDYRIAQNDKESKRLLMKLEQSKALPSLSAFVNLATTANSNSFTFFNGNQKWFNSSLLGVSLKIPIFSSFGRAAKTAQAKIALETSNLRLKETEKKLSLEAEVAKSDYQMSIENYETAKKNLNLAERIENKNQIKFREGIATSFDLLQAQNQLYSQQNNYVQSMLNVIAKKVKLENALNISIK